MVIAEEEPYSSKIAAWKAVVVDGVDIKEDTWYQLRGGELVPCEDQEG